MVPQGGPERAGAGEPASRPPRPQHHPTLLRPRADQDRHPALPRGPGAAAGQGVVPGTGPGQDPIRQRTEMTAAAPPCLSLPVAHWPELDRERWRWALQPAGFLEARQARQPAGAPPAGASSSRPTASGSPSWTAAGCSTLPAPPASGRPRPVCGRSSPSCRGGWRRPACRRWSAACCACSRSWHPRATGPCSPGSTATSSRPPHPRGTRSAAWSPPATCSSSASG